MLKIVRSPKPKHSGVLFLYDDVKKKYVGKIYADVEDQDIVAELFINAYNKSKRDGGLADNDLMSMGDTAFEDGCEAMFPGEEDEYVSAR